MSGFSGDNLKIFFIVVIFVCGWFGVLSPRCFDPFGKRLTYGNLFSSGVLMSAALVHLLGDATGDLEDSPLPKTADGESYPWGFLVCALSFYCLFIIERLFIGMYMSNMIDKQSQESGNKNNNSNHHYHNHNQADNKERRKSSHFHVDDIEVVELLLNKQYLSAILLLVGLGIHSFFAGLALGATSDFSVAVSLGIAIICHKYLAAFALGMLDYILYFTCYILYITQ